MGAVFSRDDLGRNIARAAIRVLRRHVGDQRIGGPEIDSDYAF
jgi:hypothetical protein